MFNRREMAITDPNAVLKLLHIHHSYVYPMLIASLIDSVQLSLWAIQERAVCHYV